VKIESFRATLRELRLEVVGSQKKLSERTKKSGAKPIAAMTISEIETGANAEPGILTVARLVEGMGISLALFFAEVEGRELGHETRIAAAGGFPGDRAVQAVATGSSPALEEELGRAIARYVRSVAHQQAPAPRATRPRRGKGHRKDR
jgi:transcriptional regulator with XRE-family HTH domain